MSPYEKETKPNRGERRSERLAASFVTANGSVYTYDDDRRTTRQTAGGELAAGKGVTVFAVLDSGEASSYARVLKNHTQEISSEVYILERQSDGKSKVIREITEVRAPDSLYVVILQEGEIIQSNPAQLHPSEGANVFDFRQLEHNGHQITARHLGSEVTEVRFE